MKRPVDTSLPAPGRPWRAPRILPLLLAILLAGQPAAAQSGAALKADAVADARAAADAANAPLLAPTTYGNAVREYERSRVDPGRDPAKASARRQAAATLFRTAETDARGAARKLAPALAARDAARGATAATLAPEAWQAAEKRFMDLVRRIERGDDESLAAGLQPATEAYAAAELDALRNRYLAPPRQRLAEASAAGAERHAPLTLARAQSLLAAAEAALARNRQSPDDAAEEIAAATDAAAHATRVATLARRVADRDQTPEQLVLELEGVIERLAAAASLSTAPVAGDAAATDALVAEAAALHARAGAIERELVQRDRLVQSLEEEIRELDARLGGTAAERDRLVMQAEANARRAEQVTAAGQLFRPGDAQVLQQGSDITLRLTGLQFPAGATRIGPAGKALLDRAAEALAVFPDAVITVEGHTDTGGNAATNQRLAEQRAEAVAGYLTTALRLTPGRIRAIGYGQDRPIAGNDTPAGRALNRRIDIIITPRSR
jgi:outer membrane protein OmpA-like peptidoglycan-associated protein